MDECSLPNCDNECFESETKCILHCVKNEKNNWYNINDENERIWSKNKLNQFWEKINYKITTTNSTYEEIEQLGGINYTEYYFDKIIFPKSERVQTTRYTPFDGLVNNRNINFNNCIFEDTVDFSKLGVLHDITYMNCSFLKYTVFRDMEFRGNFIFEGCKVHENIKFRNIIFKNITSFIQSKFYKKVDFIHTRFEKLALLNSLEANKLSLDNTFFSAESNFLNIKSGMGNRETARIIKNSFEQQNNIIEANKFYTLEMKEMEKELDVFKDPLEWLVFKMHSISSNHSQDYILPILWIFNLALFYSLSVSSLYHNFALGIVSITSMFLLSSIKNIDFLKTMLLVNLGVFSFLSYIKFDTISDKINPFSIMTSKDSITFGLLLFKVTIAYLIYQFIISVRQNTRRK